MEPADYEAAWKYVCAKLQSYAVAPCWNLGEFVHYYQCKRDATYSYVVEDPATKQITGFVSFYIVRQRVLQSQKHTMVNSAMIDVVFASGNVTLQQLVEDMVIVAHKSVRRSFCFPNSFVRT